MKTKLSSANIIAIEAFRKKLYKSMWLEYHDPDNWGGVTKMKKEILGAIYFLLPDCKAVIKAHPDPAEHDGWYECEIEVTFKANNKEEAKTIIYKKGLKGDDSGVFTCFEKINKKWVRVFTEEGED
jgi:hypothetical protein